MTTANNTQDLLVGLQQSSSPNLNDTQDFIVAVQQAQSANPLLAVTQDFIVVLVAGRVQNSPPAFFNLQKLVLTVKEATVPVRGRNV